jgi:hypothetical protein
VSDDGTVVTRLTAFELFARHVETALRAVRLPSGSGAIPMSFVDRVTRRRESARAGLLDGLSGDAGTKGSE